MPTKKRVRRVEKDPAGGWIARDRNGAAIYDEAWRWNSRSVARSVVLETDAAHARSAA